MSDPLTVLSDTVAVADTAAKQCESTLSASWPDAASVIHLRRLLAGTVLHVNDGTGRDVNMTFVCVPRDGVADDGTIATVPALGAGGLTRDMANARVQSACYNILTDLDGSGGMVAGGPELYAFGFPVTVVPTPTGGGQQVDLRFGGGVGGADSTRNLSSATVRLLSRTAGGGPLQCTYYIHLWPSREHDG